MKSGDARAPRGRPIARDEAQGSLDGILSPEESGMDRRADENAAGAEPGVPRSGKKPARPAPKPDPDPLLASLDALEENVTLLLARHESLVSANAASEERRRSRDTLDPIELERRLRALESDTEKLERHAAFLEDRIRGLLSRVRYVIES